MGLLSGALGAMISAGKDQELLDTLRNYPLVQYFPDNQIVCEFLIIVIAASACAFVCVSRVGLWDEGRMRGLHTIALLPIIMGFAFVDPLWVKPDEAAFKELRSHCWIGYNPLDFRPDHQSIPIAKIRGELRSIHRAGFSGIVTFASTGSLINIPRLAAEEGMSVIMGVWNPTDLHELIAAADQKQFVFGYCVGHDGLNYRYSMRELVEAVQYLRGTTNRPVTTTEAAKDYDDPGDNRLSTVSDWLFPDVHVSLNGREPLKDTDIQQLIDELMQSVRKVELLARKLRRPVMLKMLSFPHNGIQGTSNDFQKVFFQEAVLTFEDPHHGLRVDASYMVHGAFDESWKSGGKYYDWGVITADGHPLPAASEVARLCRYPQ